MRRLLGLILAVILLSTCFGCFWGYDRGGDGDRGGYGTHDRGERGESDRGGYSEHDRGGYGDRDRGEQGERH